MRSSNAPTNGPPKGDTTDATANVPTNGPPEGGHYRCDRRTHRRMVRLKAALPMRPRSYQRMVRLKADTTARLAHTDATVVSAFRRTCSRRRREGPKQ